MEAQKGQRILDCIRGSFKKVGLCRFLFKRIRMSLKKPKHMGPVLRRLQKVERHQIMLMKTEKTRRAQDFIRGSLKKLRLGEI